MHCLFDGFNTILSKTPHIAVKIIGIEENVGAKDNLEVYHVNLNKVLLSVEFLNLNAAQLGGPLLKNCELNNTFEKCSSKTPLTWYSFVYVKDINTFKKVIEWKFLKVKAIWKCHRIINGMNENDDTDSENSDDLSCPHCVPKVVFANKIGLNMHLHTHYKCLLCTAKKSSFKQVDLLARHIIEQHCHCSTCLKCDSFANSLNFEENLSVEDIFKLSKKFMGHISQSNKRKHN
jgi:hypothetical protein